MTTTANNWTRGSEREIKTIVLDLVLVVICHLLVCIVNLCIRVIPSFRMDFPFVFTVIQKRPYISRLRMQMHSVAIFRAKQQKKRAVKKFISSRFSKLADFCARCGFSIIWCLKLNRQNNWTEQSIWNPFFYYMRVNSRTRALSFATLRFTFAFGLAIRKSIIVFTYRCRFAFVVDDEKENCQLYRQTGNKIRCVNNVPHHREI